MHVCLHVHVCACMCAGVCLIVFDLLATEVAVPCEIPLPPEASPTGTHCLFWCQYGPVCIAIQLVLCQGCNPSCTHSFPCSPVLCSIIPVLSATHSLDVSNS